MRNSRFIWRWSVWMIISLSEYSFSNLDWSLWWISSGCRDSFRQLLFRFFSWLLRSVSESNLNRLLSSVFFSRIRFKLMRYTLQLIIARRFWMFSSVLSLLLIAATMVTMVTTFASHFRVQSTWNILPLLSNRSSGWRQWCKNYLKKIGLKF